MPIEYESNHININECLHRYSTTIGLCLGICMCMCSVFVCVCVYVYVSVFGYGYAYGPMYLEMEMCKSVHMDMYVYA